jgi:tRNA modification GTPase
LPRGVPVTILLNKIDLLPEAQRKNLLAREGQGLEPSIQPISAVTGEGLDELRRRLSTRAGHAEEGGGTFSARARHVEALRRAAAKLEAATAQLGAKQGELAAFELRESQRALGEVVGDVSSDELLGRIFGSFCIGK